jgi:hypothetical protein
MDLSEVYANQVKKSKISNLSVGGNFPQIQKDPTIAKLENDVLSKLKDISGPDHVKSREINKITVNSLSFEEALKELANIQKNS